MYRGFNLVILDPSPAAFAGHGARSRAHARSSDDFEELQRQLGHQDIDGDKVKDDWFNDVPASIFLSHSGKDTDLAYSLADYLKVKLNLDVFVDSRVWGGADKLLRAIDNQYCRSDDGKHYDYQKRNYSTSHVHMMLATALTEMIDRCECVIFLNTPESIQAGDAQHRAAERLASPWIYHELMMTRLISRHLDRRLSVLRESLEARLDAQDHALHISYEAPLAHFAQLTLSDMTAWGQQIMSGTRALDWLYRNHDSPPEELALLNRKLPYALPRSPS